jgi:tubulin polyglutamylase TTLL6/13
VVKGGKGKSEGRAANESLLKGGSVEGDESYIIRKKNKRVAINVYCTEYDVVKKVARKIMNYRVKELEEDHEGAVIKGQGAQKLSTVWDISWHDLAITPDYMSKMQSYQKVNHFPGMYVVCRKNFLARNLMKMLR